MEDLTVPQEMRQLTEEMKDYFSSIEDSFETSLKSSREKEGFIGIVLVISFVASFFSVLPVIPAAIWALLVWLAPKWIFTIKGWTLPMHSFFLWWVVCPVVCIVTAIAANSINERRSKLKADESLKAAPMRFALCYAIVQEIDRFTKNRLPKHIDRATSYWQILYPMLFSMLNHSTGDYREIRESAMMLDLDTDSSGEFYGGGLALAQSGRYFPTLRRIERMRRIHPWFKLAPTTAKIFDAFKYLHSKIAGRLKDKKDLPAVASILINLAAYLYCAIPETSSTEHRGNKESEQLSEESLIRFADGIEPLPEYSPEPSPLEGKERVRFKLAAAFSPLVVLFSHENPLLKFCTWWVFTQVLVVIALLIASHYVPNLKVDSTLVSLAIGTPLLVSAAALAGPLRSK